MEHTHYEFITEVIESPLDCLSAEALIAEWLIEDVTGLPSFQDMDDE